MANVFTFASNLEGRHGKGSALEARHKHGAIYGQGEGRQGNSYGIPTKKTPYITLPLSERYMCDCHWPSQVAYECFSFTPVH